MAPKRHMSIIQGHTSNAKGWFKRFFYVRIDGASVEENCLPLFCGKWNFHRGTMVGNLVRIDTRSGTSEAPLPDDFFANLPPGFTTPASLDEASRREMIAEGSRLINERGEARLSHFKAEEIERKFIRFQNEVAERERRQAESHSQALICAERKGRRTIAAELARRATLFDAEFRSFKDAQEYVAEMSGLMDGCAHAESIVPPIEGRIRELWEPIEVSEDTTEAGADAADEGGEVDQPADSLGVSMSRYLDLDL
ncbi:hypothetical protein F2Q68_00040956 [Brassica cretica]|uniref:Uncharacterized protein n=1 Tax=Brassica cretica TaxID=69181 RepID=A0A8S9MN34_BRACR|nr:hypothetical protein F2Q68_00040956 [Brassica cretica]